MSDAAGECIARRLRARAAMRIAIYQASGEAGSVARNLDLLEAMAQEAAGRGARLLICPEMFLSGYNIGPERASRLAEPADGPTLARGAAIARRQRHRACCSATPSAAQTMRSTTPCS